MTFFSLSAKTLSIISYIKIGFNLVDEVLYLNLIFLLIFLSFTFLTQEINIFFISCIQILVKYFNYFLSLQLYECN